MKYISKILQARLQRAWTMNFQMLKLDLEKKEEPDIKLPTSARLSKKQESSRKTSTSALLTMPKPLTMWITKNCGKFLKRWKYQTTWPASWEICMQVKKQKLEMDMEQQTGIKSGKECVRLYIVTLLINLYVEYIVRNTGLEEAQAGIKIAERNINNLRYADDTTLMAEVKEELKSL